MKQKRKGIQLINKLVNDERLKTKIRTAENSLDGEISSQKEYKRIAKNWSYQFF